MQHKNQKMVLAVLAALGLGLFGNLSQGQAASTPTDGPVQMTVAEENACDDTLAESNAEAQPLVGQLCNPVYCKKYPDICRLMGCYSY